MEDTHKTTNLEGVATSGCTENSGKTMGEQSGILQF